MIKSIEFIRDLGNNQIVSKNIELGAPETSGLWVKSIKGIGPGKANINVTDMASSDGGIFNSARSETRNITLTLGLVDYTDAERYYSVEDVRRDTYKIFGKKRQVMVLLHTDRISLYTYGYVESCEPDIFNRQETMSISIICPDPNFYSTTGNGGIDFSSTEPLFEFPINQEVSSDDPFKVGQFYYEYDEETDTYFISQDETSDHMNQERKSGKTYYVGGLMNNTDSTLEETEYFETSDESFIQGKEYFEMDPNNSGQYMMTPDLEMDSEKTYYEYNNKIKFADIIEIARKDIEYYGEIEVGVTIDLRFSDTATGVKIYKYLENDAEMIELDDAAIAAAAQGSISPGDEIIINTTKGQKSAILIRNAEPINVMNALGRNPDWFQLNFGINSFSYSADTGQEFIEVSISYEEAYEGV